MSRSERKTDIFGEPYIQHYDDDGNEIGRSEAKKDIFGDDYVQHYDGDRRESGRSESKRDLFGDSYEQHYDDRGQESGRSEVKRDMFGDEYVQHYDERGRETTRSVRKKDMFCDEFVEHQDRSGRALRRPREEPRSYSSSSSSSETDWVQIIIGLFILGVIITAVVTPFIPIILLGVAATELIGGGAGAVIGLTVFAAGMFVLWRFRHARAFYFFPYAFVLQGVVFLAVLDEGAGAAAAAFGGALAALGFFRLAFSAWRWRAEEGERAQAWLIAGGLAAACFVVDFGVGALRPSIANDVAALLPQQPRAARNIEAPAPAAYRSGPQFAAAPAAETPSADFAPPPFQMDGRWRGLVTEPRSSQQQYVLVADIRVDPQSNQLTATVNYPSLSCVGQWRSQAPRAEGWLIVETITQGRCARTVYIDAMPSDNESLMLQFRLAETGPIVATARLQLNGEVIAAVPAQARAAAGAWAGAYEQNGDWSAFQAQLTDIENGFSGEWTENALVRGSRQRRSAVVEGALQGEEITFVKRYEDGREIEYQGRLGPDGRFAGTWRFGELTGRFWIQRQ